MWKEGKSEEKVNIFNRFIYTYMCVWSMWSMRDCVIDCVEKEKERDY